MYWVSRSYYADQLITVPLVVIFTKFDAQIIQESVKLNDLENYQDRWAKARENADITFQRIYLASVLGTQHPPKAHVQLEGEEVNISMSKKIMFFNRYAKTRKELSWADSRDCKCYWWCQSPSAVCLNTDEQPWPLCWICTSVRIMHQIISTIYIWSSEMSWKLIWKHFPGI